MFIDQLYIINRQKHLIEGYIEEDSYYKAQAMDDILHVCLNIYENIEMLNYRPILNFRPSQYQTMLPLEIIDSNKTIMFKQDKHELKKSSQIINNELLKQKLNLKNIAIEGIQNIETYDIRKITNIHELDDYIALCKVSHIPIEYYRFLQNIQQLFIESVGEIKINDLYNYIIQIIQNIGFHLDQLEDYKGHHKQIIDAIIIAKTKNKINPLHEAYAFLKRQMGRGKNADNKMSNLLFYFRCVGSRVLKLIETRELTDWFIQSKVVFRGRTITQQDVEEIATSDPTPIDEFLNNIDIEQLVSAFGFDLVYNRDTNQELHDATELAAQSIQPIRSVDTSFMQLVDVSSLIDTTKDINWEEEGDEGEYIEYGYDE